MAYAPTLRSPSQKPKSWGVQRNLQEGMERVEFSDEINNQSFNVALIEHVHPGWVNSLKGGASNRFIQIFNEEIAC